MCKFAILKNVSFDVKTILKDSSLLQYLSDKVSFCEFNSTLELFHSVHSILGDNMVEIINCHYDDKILIQAFYTENSNSDNYENVILVKRQIKDDDSYTFLGFDPNVEEKYVYFDVSMDDIVNILEKKYKHNGVIVYADGRIRNIIYTLSYDEENHETGVLSVSGVDFNTRCKYLNMAHFVHKHEKQISENKFTEIITKKIEETNCEYLFNQKDIKIGLFNCYHQTFGHQRNELISKIMKDDVYGDVVIGLENNQNDDIRILYLDDVLFKKLIKLTENDNKYNPKNSLFCNIFYEMA